MKEKVFRKEGDPEASQSEKERCMARMFRSSISVGKLEMRTGEPPERKAGELSRSGGRWRRWARKESKTMAETAGERVSRTCRPKAKDSRAKQDAAGPERWHSREMVRHPRRKKSRGMIEMSSQRTAERALDRGGMERRIAWAEKGRV